MKTILSSFFSDTENRLFPVPRQQSYLSIHLRFIGSVQTIREFLTTLDFEYPYCRPWMVGGEHEIQVSFDGRAVMRDGNFKLTNQRQFQCLEGVGNPILEPMPPLHGEKRLEGIGGVQGMKLI